MLQSRLHVTTAPSNALAKEASDPRRHLLPALNRSQTRLNVSTCKPNCQLRILHQRVRIPQSNLLQRRTSEERVGPGKRDEEVELVLSIIRQSIKKRLVRRKPRNNALLQVQGPMISMNRPDLRPVEVSQSLFHSLRLRNIISIKGRNNLS